jgi:hypothetical protein
LEAAAGAVVGLEAVVAVAVGLEAARRLTGRYSRPYRRSGTAPTVWAA